MNCCACAGWCMHVGSHSYCWKHGGQIQVVPMTMVTTHGTDTNQLEEISRKLDKVIDLLTERPKAKSRKAKAH